MVQGQTKPVYTNSAAFGTKDQASYKKSQFDFKGQDQKSAPKMNVEKKPEPWGKTFKNEQHFKSLHIC